MSNTSNQSSIRGIRYTDAQKKEVVDYAVSYNAENSRGGQSKAAEKFGISQLTVASWLKAAGAGSPKPKGRKARGNVSKSQANRGKGSGSRYSDEQKNEVVAYAVQYNADNGRGGQSKAASKFNVSPLTVVAWLKAAGMKGLPSTTQETIARPAGSKNNKSINPSDGSISSKLSSLLDLSHQITQAESQLESLRNEFNSIKSSL